MIPMILIYDSDNSAKFLGQQCFVLKFSTFDTILLKRLHSCRKLLSNQEIMFKLSCYHYHSQINFLAVVTFPSGWHEIILKDLGKTLNLNQQCFAVLKIC